MGCGHCQQTGYIGRTGIYEIMEITKAHREAIAQNKDATVLREISLQHHMRLLADECKILVMDGITTLEELADVAVFER
ncbi:MAG: hypothetical protein ACLVLR_05005 [Turicibacter sanguinis]